MTRRQRLTRSAAIVTALAAAVPALAAAPASADTVTGTAARTPVSTANSASGKAGVLVGSLAYRGAEHPYLVGNLADAGKRFGSKSAQAKAAAGALSVNVAGISHLLAGSSVSEAKALRADLLGRDHGEVAYAAAVVAAHEAGAGGTTPAEKHALAVIAGASQKLAGAVHAAVPSVGAPVAEALLAKLNAGDERTLKAAALGQPTQFGLVEAGSINLGTAMAAIGVRESGTTAATSKTVEYRAELEIVFTEHVYQTGLFGEAVLLDGPRSAAAVAARKADDVNTALVSKGLRLIGTPSTTQSVWTRHINGYSDYLTNLKTGGSSVAAADKLFGSYERAIAADLHRAAPTLGSTAQLRTVFAMHVTGTLVVFHLEKAGSPKLYPTAQAGAAMLAGLAVKVSEAQTAIG